MIEEIASAFNAADSTLEVTVSRGRGMQADEIKERIGNKSFLNVLMGVDVEPETDVMRATHGSVIEGRLMMYSFAKTDVLALAQLKKWWRTIAPGNGVQMLHNIKTQTTLGSMTFNRWRAVGGFQDTAAPHGNLWFADQLVEYTIYT